MSKVTAVVIHEHGKPVDVARVETVEVPEVGPGDARVRMLLAPINPADLNVLEGTYPVRPRLPGVPGAEGVGRVEAIGDGVDTVKEGDLVLMPPALGTWRQALVCPADNLIPCPADIPLEQAAMLRVNPATALRMLRDFVTLAPGEWVVQNASNSGVGRAVIQLAQVHGWRTVNVVRRPELIEEMLLLGGDVVVLDKPDAEVDLRAATGDAPPRLALNAVGGDSASRLSASLAPGGTLVTYGAMSRQPLRISNGDLIFRNLTFRGFWVSQWFKEATRADRIAMFDEIFALAREGRLYTPVESIYALERAKEAIAAAAEGMRNGKILLSAD
jgi:trans-2-enoyl-CoA reductase